MRKWTFAFIAVLTSFVQATCFAGEDTDVLGEDNGAGMQLVVPGAVPHVEPRPLVEARPLAQRLLFSDQECHDIVYDAVGLRH